MDSTSPNADFSNRPFSLDVLMIWETHEFYFHVFVTNDCTDIRGIMADDDSIDAIQNLTSEMKLYYNTEESEAFSVVEGEYYAVFDDEWHRVQCTNYDSKKQLATVLFIDRGDEDEFTLDNLHHLPSKFCVLPAQHFKLSLNDLEIFRYCEEIQDILDDLLHDKDVYVRVVKFQQDKSVTSLLAEMILDKDTEKEVNINEFLLEKVFELIVDPKTFIGIDKVAQQAHISFISQEQINMQIESKGLVYLHALMNDLTNNYLNNSDYKHKLISEFDLTKLYVTKSHRDNNWYRVKVIEIKNEFEALVKFVDVGDTSLVRRRNLILLENLSKLLALYPEQAVEVKLHKISPFLFDEKLANKLRKLVLPADILYTKVVGELNGTPIVQFCKRTENNYLISINDALVIEPSTMYLEDKTVSVVDTFNSRFSFPLKTPYIPAIDLFFDVFVTMVAHPEDFTVQPLCSRYKFKQMMADLLNVCESFSGPHLTPNCVKVGYLYAALEEDDSWYRAYVYKIISKTQFGVYACDYGDYRIVTLKNMQPLQEGFCDLPYQAIKAKLVGISPDVKTNWTDNDTLRFMALIQSKNLVAIVKNLEINTAVVKGIVLSVDLVDTIYKEIGRMNFSEDALEVTDFLLKFRNIDKEFIPGFRTLDLYQLVKKNDLNLVKYLLEKKFSFSPNALACVLWYAISHEYHEMAKLLVENGADVNQCGLITHFYDHRKSLLSWAVYCRNKRAVKLLLKHGAKVNDFDCLGAGALYFAISRQEVKIARLLLDNGANINCKDDQGNSMLHIAVGTGLPDMIKLFIKFSADVSVTNIYGQNALHYAVQGIYDFKQIVVFLVKLGVPVNGLDNHKETPLHYAISLRKTRMATTLLEYSADVNAMSKDKIFPLFLAVADGCSHDLVKLIVEKEANKNGSFISQENLELIAKDADLQQYLEQCKDFKEQE
ncbi:hypothetical protein TSAR_011135 [Trichomalopsis sarcophagae]|uniref:Tudor domain-containing protein n=1 Tax=Trichomalopsis sarcophagae TaxID=543379 RepID=A0A232FGW7_9HYME|nr:hypothetical protein TSAR_011135 [Trichomalopsis sarcophagae]